MSHYPTTEGEVSHKVTRDGIDSKTWYKVIGELKSSPQTPLICLHGGPGAGHEYFASCIDLYEKYGIPLILYDQIGCGRSTHFRDKMGDASFWTFQLFMDELDNLIDHLDLRNSFSILGHSWGGMLGAVYAATRPVGLKKLLISSAPASIPLYIEAGKILRSQLPDDVRAILEKGDKDGDLKDPEYERASAVFYSNYVCRLDPRPEPINMAFKNIEDDPTAYLTIQGPSEIVVTGSLKDWDGSEDARNIEVETLLLTGKYDEMHEICVEPGFKCIPRVKWIIFEDSSHMAFWEERARFMETVGAFLRG